ncbi:hypothetical protein [Oleiagrimonas sp. MCCC 1A03011]|uniref:hypothetical protein n=1 Tax=Oleiagrimonas sp. MCCC 1A03011 TaxID=1926883 RepID=UPI000DC4526F|nr:hypothetical protein [Oleiagrimonas sp. MCCC 1A03011]RAP57346.1 hypothetical protein BTJ49_09700 [Oleiagrimonas sp. MCCC 1A03011]
MSKKSRDRKVTVEKVTWAQAFRDIIIAAMNKGQLIPVLLGLALLIWMVRVSPDELSKFGYRCVELIVHHHVLGYVLWIMTLLGWVMHARFAKGTTDAESSRIGKEKTALQERIAGGKLPSSRA